MCGIVGLVKTDGSYIDPSIIENMTAAITHRGPTGGGTLLRGPVGLGNRRLAIIDLDGGKQPISNEDGEIWITYNGEIYNYQEIRKGLLAKGHLFKTNSDTEMIVHAYEEWGDRCVEHFRGMFAFAILDQKKQVIFLARDQLGIKPLYYLKNPGIFAFSSEIQAFHCIPGLNLSLDTEAIDQYLWLQYIPAPKSVFLEVKKLPPAHRMRVSFTGEHAEPEEFWNLNFIPDNKLTEADWIEAADETLRDSVKSHLVSDVPFGAFLSGGVDSSAVVAYMSQVLNQPVKTFSIGFEEEEFNELKYANIVANIWKTDHHTEIVRPDALKILPNLVKHYGEPFGDSSAIPTYYVSRLAQETVPMVLSGDGGDESFAGYNTYSEWMRCMDGKGRPLWKKIFRPAASVLFPERYPPMKPNLKSWLHFMNYLNQDERLFLWRDEYKRIPRSNQVDVFENAYRKAKNYSKVSMVQYLDIKTYLPYDILTKVDIASMMHGLEVRTPIVDIKVLELIARIPQNFQINYDENRGWKGKQILKKVISKYYSNDFLNRPKMGFGVPVQKWFASSGALYEYINDRLLNKHSLLDQFFKRDAITTFIKKNDYRSIWLLLFFDEWLNQNHKNFTL